MEKNETEVLDRRAGELRAKIRWQCRRGMLELELFLLVFFEKHFDHLANDEQQSFIDLLAEADPVLYDWIIGKEPPAEPFVNIIGKLTRLTS